MAKNICNVVEMTTTGNEAPVVTFEMEYTGHKPLPEDDTCVLCGYPGAVHKCPSVGQDWGKPGNLQDVGYTCGEK